MLDSDLEFMKMAVACAEQAKDNGGKDPRVGAVAVKDGKLLETAYRGERPDDPDEHAEYVLVYHKMAGRVDRLADATVYTTLEPCTKRGRTRDGKEKTPCAKWLADSKVARVVVGMWDPNQQICGKGCRLLRDRGIIVDVFPHDLMKKLEAMNRDWAQKIQRKPINRKIEEIFDLATHVDYKSDRAQWNVLSVLEQCVGTLNSGSVLIPNGEAGYFTRLRECVEKAPDDERFRAFIRLNSFRLDDLMKEPAYQNFYSRLYESVGRKNIVAEYTFLVSASAPNSGTRAFIDRYKECASVIRTVYPTHTGIRVDRLHPSIVLLERQKIAFTHDRDSDTQLLTAREWMRPDDFARLENQWHEIEFACDEYYRR